MTDQTPEQPTSEPAAPTTEVAAGLPAAFTPMQVENFITLDQIMTSARRSQRTAKICLAADLEAEYLTALEELGNLVDAEGHLLNEDASLGETGDVAALRDRIAALHEQMDAQTYSVLFEAMDSDTWDVFEKTHRDAAGAIKDTAGWQNELIATCAIKPTMSVDDVKKIRKQLGPQQITTLAATALSANQTGGVDVPKLPSFWHSPKPAGSSLN